MTATETPSIPQHVAIIMDGNGRWAKAQNLDRIEGHRQGVNKSEEIITFAREIGVSYLTLYAFSFENWQRPPAEVDALMMLLKTFLEQKKQKMLDNGIRLNAIGDLARLPDEVKATLDQTMAATAGGDKMVLSLALSYGGRDEILRAIQKMAQSSEVDLITIDETQFADFLDTQGMPDPDLIIRTSGEHRVSNFLVWQGAYSEYVFVDHNWPDFTTDDLMKAIADYQKRERRFGMISEQVK